MRTKTTQRSRTCHPAYQLRRHEQRIVTDKQSGGSLSDRLLPQVSESIRSGYWTPNARLIGRCLAKVSGKQELVVMMTPMGKSALLVLWL
jgi:hypothetical protein